MCENKKLGCVVITSLPRQYADSSGVVVDARTLPIEAARPSRPRNPIDALIWPRGRRTKHLGRI